MKTKLALLPREELARLKKNELTNRSRARNKGLPVVSVSVEALWLLQQGNCPCPNCRYEKPLVIGEIVIAHREYLSGTGSPGHVPHNVELWNSWCNASEGRQETSDHHKNKRFKPDCMDIADKRERKKRVGGSIPKRKNAWPSGRKIPSRGFRQ